MSISGPQLHALDRPVELAGLDARARVGQDRALEREHELVAGERAARLRARRDPMEDAARRGGHAWGAARGSAAFFSATTRSRVRGSDLGVVVALGVEHAGEDQRGRGDHDDEDAAAERANGDGCRLLRSAYCSLGGSVLVVVIAAAALILPGVFDAKRDNDAKVAAAHAETRGSRGEAPDPRAAPQAWPPRRAASSQGPRRAPASSSPPATSSCSRSRARSWPTRAGASRPASSTGPSARGLRAADRETPTTKPRSGSSSGGAGATTAWRSSGRS